jgi:hypothetical protein
MRWSGLESKAGRGDGYDVVALYPFHPRVTDVTVAAEESFLYVKGRGRLWSFVHRP